MPLTREQTVLAALAGGERSSYSPAQVQKLLFLLDREASQWLGGPHFNFKPYDYGPFDRAVYDVLDELAAGGLVSIDHNGWYRIYSLSEDGLAEGKRCLAAIDAAAAQYLRQAAAWVKARNFKSLVSAIYTKYPEMRANSIFRE